MTQAAPMQQSGIAIPLSIIVPGKNPRTYFDPAEHEQMKESVRQQGVFTPILLRPVADGKLQIVAGERRWRAASDVGLDSIPALIREMSDEEAAAAALSENTLRTPMSPTEEAEAASRILGQCAGDRIEAAKRMAWNPQTLDKRLALMNCSESVRKALNERKILLGHAELLAAVTKEKQDIVLKRLLDAAEQPTVPQLKAMLEDLAQNLESAIFDKTDCAACPRNSSLQAALFSEAISGAKCTDGHCFKLKTEDKLVALADGLKDDYQTIRIVRPGENFTILRLVAEGNCGVGEEQAQQCRGCDKFGAAVSAIPGSVGKIYTSQCFDPACNAKKVAERVKVEKAATVQSTPANKATLSNGKAATAAPDGKKAATSAKPKVEIGQSVKDYRLKTWRKVFKLEAQSPVCSQILLVVLAVTGKLGKVGSSMMTKAFEGLTQNRLEQFNLGSTCAMVEAAGVEVQSRLVNGIAASCFEGLEEKDIVDILAYLQVDLGKHWVLNAEYLELLTKSQIQVVAEDLGIAAHLGDKFAKVMSGKKAEIIKELLAIDNFDYKGKVPAHLHYSS